MRCRGAGVVHHIKRVVLAPQRFYQSCCGPRITYDDRTSPYARSRKGPAQASCGGTYSSPVGTNSLVNTSLGCKDAVTPPYCLRTWMVEAQSSSASQPSGFPLVCGVTQVFQEISKPRFTTDGSEVG